MMCHDAPKSPIHMFFMIEKHVSPLTVHIIPASEGSLTSHLNQTFFFMFSFFYFPSSAKQHYIILIPVNGFFYNPDTCALFCYNGSIPQWFFLFSFISVFLCYSSFLLFILESSNHDYREKRKMAMAQWITLLKCHRIQLCFKYQDLELWLSHCSISALSWKTLISQSTRKIGFLAMYLHHLSTITHHSYCT